MGRHPAPSVTAYHLTNSGQGPDIDVFQLPSEVVGFLRAVSRAGTDRIWRGMETAAWERRSAGKEKRVDALVSWNFRHLVILGTRREAHAVNLRRGYPLVEIVAPEVVQA